MYADVYANKLKATVSIMNQKPHLLNNRAADLSCSFSVVTDFPLPHLQMYSLLIFCRRLQSVFVCVCLFMCASVCLYIYGKTAFKPMCTHMYGGPKLISGALNFCPLCTEVKSLSPGAHRFPCLIFKFLGSHASSMITWL